MNKKFIHLAIIIVVLLCLKILPSYAQGSDISNRIGQYVDLTSIGKDYKIHHAVSDLKTFYQIVFINLKNRQRMSITSYRQNTAFSHKEMKDFLKNTLTKLRIKDETGFENKNISIGSFALGQQIATYFLMDQYDNNKLSSRAMIGGIPNYNGYFIIIQSFSDYDNYNQALAEDFFKKIKIKTRNMY